MTIQLIKICNSTFNQNYTYYIIEFSENTYKDASHIKYITDKIQSFLKLKENEPVNNKSYGLVKDVWDVHSVNGVNGVHDAHDSHDIYNIDEIGFFAPYLNYYTTFSTTLIEILIKIDIVKKDELVRIEKIFFTPQDPLIYKYFPSLEHYQFEIKHINENCYLQDKRHFKLLMLDYNQDDPLFTKQLKELTKDDIAKYGLTYFDCMSWVQCNSEHSRHWLFRSKLKIQEKYNSKFIASYGNLNSNEDYEYNGKSLLDIIKSTLFKSSVIRNSLIAFSDNSSAIVGKECQLLRINSNDGELQNKYTVDKSILHPCLTAETHNYPTYYHPFEGASTGVGGRIRDSLATGRGSVSSASLIGYSVNNYDLLKS